MACYDISKNGAAAATAGGRIAFADTAVPRALSWILGGVVLALVAIGLGLAVRKEDAVQAFFAENGPIELLQAICLAIAGLIFAKAFLGSRGARALYCLGAFGAIVTAATREVPRCGSPFYEGGMCLTGSGKDTVVVAGLVLCVLALLWRPLNWREALHPAALRWVWPFFAVVAILGGAEFSEHMFHEELEESLELAAYLYLIALGLWFLRASRQHPHPGGAESAPLGQQPSR